MTAEDDNKKSDHEPNGAETEPQGARSQTGEGARGEPVQSELEALRVERDRIEDRLKRAMADLANLKRRQLADAEDTRHRALEGISAELLPVLDTFGHALTAGDHLDPANVSPDVSALVEGVRMVRTLLLGVLERHGLGEIPAETGQQFDPNVHEAVGFDAESNAPEGSVARVLQPGYRFRDKVLRATRVLVAGAGASGGTPSDTSDES